jgi:hypothetical protein
MHYVLYIPDGLGYQAHDLLASAGLAALYDRAVDVLVSDVEDGPDKTPESGGRGKLVRWHDKQHDDRNATPAIADKQWVKSEPDGRFWLGWHADHPPQPVDLQRNAALNDDPSLSSFPVVLNDGRRWWVPVARDLPKCYVQDPLTGQQMLAPQTPFRKFWDATLAMGQAWKDCETFDVELPGLFDYAVDALALNYRLCREIVLLLRLFAANDPIDVLSAAVEKSSFFERRVTIVEHAGNLLLEKKKRAASRSKKPATGST